jgi:hypothetical protein
MDHGATEARPPQRERLRDQRPRLLTPAATASAALSTRQSLTLRYADCVSVALPLPSRHYSQKRRLVSTLLSRQNHC